MDKLNILSPYDTRVFHSTIEGNYCLVRTGTINDKILSFFNSILIASSKNFKNMKLDERVNLCKKIRDNIFNKITKDQWKNNGINLFKTILESTLKDFYEFINTNNIIKNTSIKKIGKQLITDKKQFELFKIITEILPYDKIILDDILCNIETYKNRVFLNVKNYLTTLDVFDTITDEQTEHIIKNISEFIKLVLNEVEYISFKTYEYDIKEINDIVIDTVANYFNTNIYFLNSSSRLPFVVNDLSNFKYLKSVIILNIDNKQYESVGVLSHGNIINREFLSNDKLILKINSLLQYDFRKILHKEDPEILNETTHEEPINTNEVTNEEDTFANKEDEDTHEEVKDTHEEDEDTNEEVKDTNEEVEDTNEEVADTNKEIQLEDRIINKDYRKYIDESTDDSDNSYE
jgi:hypothetical protein